MYKALSDEEKKPFVEMAAKAQQDFKIAMAEFKVRHELEECLNNELISASSFHNEIDDGVGEVSQLPSQEDC